MSGGAISGITMLLSECGVPGTLGGHSGGEPVFHQPWHAQLVAITLALSRSGLFTWREWVECFSSEIALMPQSDGEDFDTAYYRQWMSAFEAMLDQKQILMRDVIGNAQEDWRLSYLNTVHGKPVQFRRGLTPPVIDPDMHHHYDHHDHPARNPDPVAISPAISGLAKQV